MPSKDSGSSFYDNYNLLLFIYLFIYLFLLAVSTSSGLESCSYGYLFASVGR